MRIFDEIEDTWHFSLEKRTFLEWRNVGTLSRRSYIVWILHSFKIADIVSWHLLETASYQATVTFTNVCVERYIVKKVELLDLIVDAQKLQILPFWSRNQKFIILLLKFILTFHVSALPVHSSRSYAARKAHFGIAFTRQIVNVTMHISQTIFPPFTCHKVTL